MRCEAFQPSREGAFDSGIFSELHGSSQAQAQATKRAALSISIGKAAAHSTVALQQARQARQARQALRVVSAALGVYWCTYNDSEAWLLLGTGWLQYPRRLPTTAVVAMGLFHYHILGPPTAGQGGRIQYIQCIHPIIPSSPSIMSLPLTISTSIHRRAPRCETARCHAEQKSAP